MNYFARAKVIGCKTPDYPLRNVKEAAPHFQNLILTVSYSGVRETDDGTNTLVETYSGTFTNVLVRHRAIGGIGDHVPYGQGLDDDADDTDALPEDLYLPVAGEFVARLGLRGFDMAKQEFFLHVPTFLPETIGTFELIRNSDSEVLDSGDITGNVLFEPRFRHSTPPLNYRTPADVWGVLYGSYDGEFAYADMDISGWSNLQWRAKSGINSASISEADLTLDAVVTSTVTVTYEWELL